MPDHPRLPDPRRRLAAELAERLTADEELRRVRRRLAGEETDASSGRLGELVDALGVRPPQPAAAAPAVPPAATASEPRAISIWQPAEEDGELCWRRPDPAPLGDHYAAERLLRPRRAVSEDQGAGRRRVCFFGESAAAGYLYAPHLTPAKLLASQLTEIDGAGAWEVVDLARTNERLPTLLETVEASLQLEPDVLVVFAGNNWTLLETPELSPSAPSVAARRRLAAGLAAEGVAGPARLARRELAVRAAGAMERLEELAAGRPVIVVVPEVNLADWETAQPVTWLPGEATARWHELHRAARAHLAAGEDFVAVEAAAWEMVELDGGTCPTPFRLLAAALAAQGRPAEAREAALSEVDTLHYPLMACLAAPQAGVVARTVLARSAAAHGFAVVDLAEIFASWTSSPLPGRRFFLDYCHLSSEGMWLAMAAAAAAVRRRAGNGEGIDWRQLAERLPAPRLDPEAEAVAWLGAAVHTAHRLLPVTGRKPELLRHWCTRAIEASPGVAGAFLDLAAARAAPAPPLLSTALERNQASRYPLLLQHGWSWDGLDGDLLEAMTDVLEAVGAEADGEPAAAVVRRRLLAGGSCGERAVELAVPAFFHAEPLARFFAEAMPVRDLPGRATYRSPWPRSAFHLVVDGAHPVVLRLTARLPAVEGWSGRRRGPVAVTVNGVAVGRTEFGEEWSRHRFRIAAVHLQPGINRVELAWPPPPPAGREALAAARRRLDAGRGADLHPVFGEVFSLRAVAMEP